MLDVGHGVEVYGQLLIPRNMDGPTAAVICQHGLNGIPDEVTGLNQTEQTCYHEFGRHLAEHGYVVFAPLVLHHYPVEHVDKQVRKATSVGMMRLAMVVAKTQRVIDFLQTLSFVDAERIGYYGLSYGGYSAIWSAPLIERLGVTISSTAFSGRRPPWGATTSMICDEPRRRGTRC
jgi:dienelactone hydrolase